MFGNVFGEKMQTYVCTFTIYMNSNNPTQAQTVQAPRLMLEQQFAALVQDAANNGAPVQVIMSRYEPVKDPYSGKVKQQEYYVRFKNNAHIKVYGEE